MHTYTCLSCPVFQNNRPVSIQDKKFSLAILQKISPLPKLINGGYTWVWSDNLESIGSKVGLTNLQKLKKYGPKTIKEYGKHKVCSLLLQIFVQINSQLIYTCPSCPVLQNNNLLSVNIQKGFLQTAMFEQISPQSQLVMIHG